MEEVACKIFGFDLKDWTEIVRNLLLAGTAVLAYLTYRSTVNKHQKKDQLDRYGLISKLLDTFDDDLEFQRLVKLLENQPSLELAGVSKETKYKFMGFIEEIEVLIENNLISENFALYMFGYYARLAYNHQQFLQLTDGSINLDSPYWRKFKHFAQRADKFNEKLNSIENIKVDI